jgi:hypothetical protein
MMKYSPDWDFSFMMDPSVKCSFCLKSDMPMLVRGGEVMGLCEPCAAIVHHLWRQAPGEVPPEYPESAKTEISKVYVLIPKLGNTNVKIVDDKEVHTKAEAVLPSSYEFVMRPNEQGLLDLPGVNVLPGESLRLAAERALRLVKAMTWPHPDFIQPLYTAYTPRGRLAAVMLVTAWRLEDADAAEDGLDWRKWPIYRKPTPMAGFYKALDSVWAMRLDQHYRATTRTEMISVRVRGAGAKYIALQQLVRAQTPDLDTSLAEVMRRLMTDDERLIDKFVGEHEILSRELLQQKKADAQAVSEGGSIDTGAMVRMSRGEQVLVKGVVHGTSRPASHDFGGSGRDDPEPGSEGSVLSGSGEDSVRVEDVDSPLDASDADGNSEEAADENEEDVGAEVPEGPPPEGFVRRGRDLVMKKEPDGSH